MIERKQPLLATARPEMGGSVKKQEAVRRYVRSRAPRMQWTAELHRSFLQAIECLGGEHNATPKLVLQVMGVKELTISHVKSHLQVIFSSRLHPSLLYFLPCGGACKTLVQDGLLPVCSFS